MNKRELLTTIAFLIVLGFSYLVLDTPFDEAVDTAEEISGEVMGDVIDNTPTYTVVDVVDGDTIKLYYNGGVEKIRLLGIDTPETKECYYEEATRKLSAFLLDKQVKVEFDQTQGEKDRYGRWLMYIWVGETLINREMVADGYAFEYTYNAPYKYQESFQEAEQEARLFKRGLWGDACN